MEMTNSDELRGSAPVMSAKELLLELRTDVKAMRSQMDVLASQCLNERLTAVEEWQTKADGRMDTIVRGIPLLSASVGIIGGLLAMLGLHLVGGG